MLSFPQRLSDLADLHIHSGGFRQGPHPGLEQRAAGIEANNSRK
jgi:hypothetical protein